MRQTKADTVRQWVREAYTKVAEADDRGDCCGEAASCCGVSADSGISAVIPGRLGYSANELGSVPGGADKGLGCGNPRAIAGL